MTPDGDAITATSVGTAVVVGESVRAGEESAVYIRHLSLVDFRSWPSVDLPLGPGPTVLVGRNGAGKTNLIEAIGFLATLGSHRVAADAPLIRRGAELARVAGAVVSAGRALTIEVDITAGKANKARINKAPQRRARDILGLVRTVLFAPEDLSLVRGDPSDRRRFLDELLVMRAPRLAGVKADYDKILKQRSTLLKSAGAARRAGSGLATLDVWDEHLATSGAELLAARLSLLDELRPHVTASYAAIAPESSAADIAYRTALFEPNSREDASGVVGAQERETAVLAAALRAEMQRLRTQELERGVCLVGPHRDDLDILLHDGPAKGFASHGESWSLALALRLASFHLLRDDGIEPILLLDDVFAELDAARRDTLTEIAAQAEQAIITAAVGTDVPERFTGMTLSVADGAIVEPVR
jgi:DNA replication and repair protein RecF